MQHNASIYLISNMYPSATDSSYGIFVRNTVEILKQNNLYIHPVSCIRGRSRNKIIKAWKYLKFYFSIIVKGLSSKYDFIYAHFIPHSAIPLYIIGLLKKKPLVVNFHGSDLFKANPFFIIVKPIVQKLLANNTRLIVVPSCFLKTRLLNTYRCSEKKVFTYPSGGIDRNLFNCPIPQREDSIHKSLASNHITFGYASHIVESKGYRVFLEAIFSLQRHIQINFDLVFAGKMFEKDRFNNLLHEYGFGEKTTYYGEVPQKELPAIFARMDVFIFPTLLPESLGLVGLEAMSCGLPVIASRIGAIPEYIRDGENGFLFDAGNHEMLMDKIISFIKLDSHGRLNLSKEATWASQKYDSMEVNRAFIEELRSLPV